MKSWTYFRIILLSLILGACSRNPLGEDLSQPILNLGFTISTNCAANLNQDAAFSCPMVSDDPTVLGISWSLAGATSCMWASIDPVTGVITGTPDDNQVGTCQITVGASNSQRQALPYSFNVQVQNIAPTLTIANAANIIEDAASSVIRVDATVQASEEGYGIYYFDHITTTAPRCVDNATSLSIDQNTGAVTFTPAADYSGTCNIRVAFDDQNVAPNSVVTSEFSITVTAVNDAPILAAIANQTTNESTPIVVPITVSDVDNVLTCSAASLTVTSSNPALVPNGSISIGGAIPNCTLTISPIALANGLTTITIVASDGILNATRNFDLNVIPVPDPPVLAAIANQSGPEDVALAFTINITDTDTVLACNSTYLSATSSNPALLPVANIVFGGAPPNCNVTMTPVANINGSSNLVFTLTDGTTPVTQSFTATYTAVNDAPTIAAIANQTASEDNSIAVNFTIADVDSALTCAGSVSATSSNPGLLPVANIVFTGVAPNCTATMTPALDASGVSNIGFTVTDGLLNNVSNFTATYTAVNDAPVLSAIGNQTSSEDTALVVNFTISDVDNAVTCAGSMSATSSNAAVIPVANIVFTGVAPNCTATMTPVADTNGVSNISFTLTDGSLTSVQNFTATYSAVNDTPVLSAIANQIASEDNSIAVNFTVNDVDNVLLCTTLNLAATSSNAALLPVANIVYSGVAPNCTATLTPVADANGVSTVTITLSDNGTPNLQSVQTFTATYNAVNDAPVLSVIGNQSMTQDTSFGLNFTISDVDNAVTCAGSMSATSSNAGLIPVANIVFTGVAPNCTATFTPVLLQNGVSNIGFTLTDGVLTSVQNFTLTVNAVNYPPVLSAIANQTASEDNSIAVNFTISDPDNAVVCTSANLSATSSNPALLPVVNIVYSGAAPNCTVTMTPVLDGNGTTNIVLSLTDGTNTVTRSFSATYNAVNDAPTIAAIANQAASEDNSIAVNFTIADVDSAITCAASVSATSSNAAVIPVANIVFTGVAPNCTATMTPVLDATGVSNIGFTVTDGSLTNVSNFTATYNAVNDAPVLSAIANQTASEDNSIAVNFTINDVDSVLTCAASISATSSNPAVLPVGSIVFTGVAPNCTATMTPVANISGVSNIGFTLTDGSLTSVQNFTATYNAVNDAPTISVIANQTASEDNSIAVNFTIADVDSVVACTGANLSAASSNPALLPVGSIVFSGVAPNCTATLTPVADGNGVSTVDITVSDGSLSNLQSFTATYTAVNDGPIISAIGNQTMTQDTSHGVNFTISDVDNAITCAGAMSATSSNAGLIPVANIVFTGVAPNCTVTFTPVLLQNGVSNISVTVSDGSLTAVRNFTLTVNAVNYPPVLSAIANQVGSEDNSIAVNFTISDPDDVVVCTSANLSATSSNVGLLPVANIVFTGVAPNCTATMTPVADQNGVSNIVISLTDNSNPAVTRSFTATYNATNDAPTIAAIANQIASEDNSIAVNFTINDIDSALTCAGSVSATSSNVGVLPVANIVFTGVAPNCTATMTPVLDATGVSNIGFTVTDGSLTNVSNFTATYNAVNDNPIISAIANQIGSEDNSIAVNFTISDVDSVLTCAGSVSATSSNVGLLPVANIVFTGVAPNCTATMTPAADQNGVSNIGFTVSDGSLTNVSNFTATYNATNDNPTISAIANQIGSEDNSIAVNFTINDIDSVLTCAGSVSATSSNVGVLPVANIVFTGVAPNCTATMTPVLDANGVSNIGFTVTDGSLTNVSNFTATYNATNDAPTISLIANQSTSEDTALVVNFTINDVDSVLNCGTSVVATSSVPALIPVASIVFTGVAPNCTATMTPVADANGVSNIGFTVSDGSLSNVSNFTATYTAVNDAPILSAIGNQTANEDNAIVINFTVTDVDSVLLCTSLNLSATSSVPGLLPVANIVFSGVAPNCTATLTPVADGNGTTNIVFTLADNGTPNLQSTQNFTATYTAVNDPPTMAVIANQTTTEDNALAVNFTINDIDSAVTCAGSVSATSSDGVLIPVLNIVFTGVAPNCTATVTPAANLSGVSTLGFTVTDGSLSAVRNFTFTVTAVDDPPIISAIGAQTTNEDNALVVNFTISDVDSVVTCAGSMSSTSSNAGLIPTGSIVFGGAAPNCTATMTPVANGNGTSNIGFIVTDTVTPVTQGFVFTVTAINDPPTISAIVNQTTNEDVPLAVNFTINDPDNVLTCAGSVSALSSDGVVQPVAGIVFSGAAPNCTATMTPGLDQSGLSNITFTVTDGSLNNVSNFSLTVVPQDDIPVISAIANQTINEDGSVVVNFTITDPDSVLTCLGSMSAASSNLGLLPLANITFGGAAPNCTATLVPVANGNGTSTVTLTVTDGTNPVNSAFLFTVNSVNDNPTISAIANQTTTEDTQHVINFTINDVDNVLTCAGSVSVTSSNPTLMPLANISVTGTAPNCTITYNPALNRFGFSNISMFVLDGVGGVAIRSYRVTFTAVNDPPVIQAIANPTIVQNTSAVVNFTITDVDDTLDCIGNMSVATGNGALIPTGNVVFGGTAPNCNATLTPTANTWGNSAVDFTVDDFSGIGNLTATSNFTLIVTQVVSKALSSVSLVSVSPSELTPTDIATVTITLRDVGGNQMSTGGETVTLALSGVGTSSGTLSAVTDNNNGTYTATLTATTIGTANSIVASVGGVALTSAPSAFTIIGRSCQQHLTAGFTTDGIYAIDPDGAAGIAASFNVYCDQTNDGGGWMLAAIPRNNTAVFAEAAGLIDPTVAGPSKNSNIFSKTNSSISFSQLRLTDAWPQTKRNIANFGSAQTFNGLFTTYSSYSQNNVVVSGASVTSSIGSTCFVIRGMSANVAAYNGTADWMFMGFHSSCATPLNTSDNWDTTNGTTQWLVGAHDNADPEAGNSSVGFGNGGHWEFSGNNIDTKTILWVK